jgi:hypothetical protein
MKTNVAITSMIIGTKPAPTPKKVGSKLAASPQKGTGTIDGFLAFQEAKLKTCVPDVDPSCLVSSEKGLSIEAVGAELRSLDESQLMAMKPCISAALLAPEPSVSLHDGSTTYPLFAHTHGTDILDLPTIISQDGSVCFEGITELPEQPVPENIEEISAPGSFSNGIVIGSVIAVGVGLVILGIKKVISWYKNRAKSPQSESIEEKKNK